jgi:hypothetical protein
VCSSDLRDTVELPTMRVTTLWPATRWSVVWKNVQLMPGTELVKVQWYQLIHDIVPTNARLRRIDPKTSEKCESCAGVDTVP